MAAAPTKAELKRELEASRRRESQLRQIIDLVPDYIFATDEDGRFLIVNETLAGAYGRSVEQVCGKLESDLTPDAQQSRKLLSDNAAVLATQQPLFIPEQDVVDAHGRQLTVQIHRIPYEDAATGRRAVLGLGTDISERKRIEEALREKDRIEHDLSVARRIQRGLLPKAPPQLSGFAMAGWNESADETGGDYFDWLTLEDGRTVFSMGDVSGHGLGSAMIVAVCRAYVRASTSTLSSLEEAVDQVNALLAHDLPADRFITLVTGLLDCEEHRVSLFSAGHGPIFFYQQATHSVSSWPADDLPLGVARVERCAARDVVFDPGDILVLITDGFFEWANAAGERFGIERLEHTLREAHQLPPHELIQQLHKEVLAFADGTIQDDDLTAVVLKRTS